MKEKTMDDEMIEDEEEIELLPIDEETGEIAYDKVDDVDKIQCPVFFENMFSELASLNFPQTLRACILSGVAMLFAAAFLMILYYIIKILPLFMLCGLCIGFFGTWFLVILAKLKKRKSNNNEH